MSQEMHETTLTELQPTEPFVVPNGGWGRGDDWTRDDPIHAPKDVPGCHDRYPPLPDYIRHPHVGI